MLMAAQTGGAATLPTVRGMLPCRGIRLSSRPSRPPYNECEIRRSWSSREALTLWGVGLRTASWGRTETRRQLALYSTTARLQHSQPLGMLTGQLEMLTGQLAMLPEQLATPPG